MLNIITDFISNAKRIFQVSKKPTNKEFMEMAKVTGLGIAVIGIIGYIIILIFQYFKI